MNFLLAGGVLRAVGDGILVGVLGLLELALEFDYADFGRVELLQRIVEAARELLLLALDRFQLSLGLAQTVLEVLDLIADLLAHPAGWGRRLLRRGARACIVFLRQLAFDRAGGGSGRRSFGGDFLLKAGDVFADLFLAVLDNNGLPVWVFAANLIQEAGGVAVFREGFPGIAGVFKLLALLIGHVGVEKEVQGVRRLGNNTLRRGHGNEQNRKKDEEPPHRGHGKYGRNGDFRRTAGAVQPNPHSPSGCAGPSNKCYMVDNAGLGWGRAAYDYVGRAPPPSVDKHIGPVLASAHFSTPMLERQVLVLNRLWQAVNICSVRSAFTPLFQGHAQVVSRMGTTTFLPTIS